MNINLIKKKLRQLKKDRRKLIKKRIAVISISYPTNVSKYVGQYIKTRVDEYNKYFNVKVYIYNNILNINYKLNSIDIFVGSPRFISAKIKKFNPCLFVLHACSGNRKFNNMIINLKKELRIPLILNIHGFEVIDLLRFTFYEVFNFIRLLKHILLGLRQYIILFANKIIVKNADLIVSPGKWMHRIAEKSLFMKIKNIKYIPNFINEKLFKDRKKVRKKEILSIRSFDYRKYANEISVKLINYLFKEYKDIIKNASITFYGQGRYFNKVKSKDKEHHIHFIQEFVQHEKMPELFSQYKYFLCPTRMDAQGVSMCEAMMSGMIPITLKNTAIPEFVPAEILNKNYKQMGKLIIKLGQDNKYYNHIRQKCKNFIKAKCSYDNTISKEIKLYKNYCKKSNYRA